MKFFILMICLMAMTQFHRREHMKLGPALFDLQAKLGTAPPAEHAADAALKEADWWLAGQDGPRLSLKRAFQATTGFEAILRYAAPMVFLAALMLALENWALAAAYFACLAVKWFATTTVLVLSPDNPRYEVRLLGLKIMGEHLRGPEAKNPPQTDPDKTAS